MENNIHLRKHFPILFNNGTCTSCGKENTLRMHDKFGNIVDPDIKPVAYIQCKFCHATYGQDWKIDEDNNLYALPVNPSLKDTIISKLGTISNNIKEDIFNLLH